MKKVYDAADNGKGCYDAAIEAKRLRGDDYYLKPKKAKRRSSPEAEAQSSIIGYLTRVLPSSCMAFHVNNTPRNAIHGGKLKKLGLVPGVADICLIRAGGSVAFIEVKAEGGRLSPAQIEFSNWCEDQGVPYAVCRSIDDARDTLSDWNIHTKEAA